MSELRKLNNLAGVRPGEVIRIGDTPQGILKPAVIDALTRMEEALRTYGKTVSPATIETWTAELAKAAVLPQDVVTAAERIMSTEEDFPALSLMRDYCISSKTHREIAPALERVTAEQEAQREATRSEIAAAGFDPDGEPTAEFRKWVRQGISKELREDVEAFMASLGQPDP